MPKNQITADFTHVDACVEHGRTGTVEAWLRVTRLPVNEAILNHAGEGRRVSRLHHPGPGKARRFLRTWRDILPKRLCGQVMPDSPGSLTLCVRCL